ncbi:hypothetical protein ACFXJ8_29375 [Nonomuraea sp. NPDC059194]|uniref:hypothetical protein n=1 Tax=Nonomuraea sp. NPDC059194 TaxID=3346764 RepID=UPI0036A0711B
MLGALVSGAVVGAVAGIASVIPEVVRLWALLPALLVIMSFELVGRPLSLPQNRRLVPQDVIPKAEFEGPLQFGFEMGTGVRTFTPTALPHLLVAVIVLAGGLGPGLLAGVGFGVGRALMPYLRSRSADSRQWDRDLLRALSRLGQICAAGFLLAVAVILL